MSLAQGTTPDGAETEEQATRWVRGMFGQIAGRYDLLNHLLSFQMDRAWRAKTAARVTEILSRPDARVLDMCCGTGDLMLELEHRRRGSATRKRDGEAVASAIEMGPQREGRFPTRAIIFGSDFCHPMLIEARRKAGSKQASAAVFEADALQLPLANASLDLITIAFGVRNFANYRKGLTELRRVLCPGGMLAILEFSQPPNRLLAGLYRFYSKHVLPRIGGLVSGSSQAYSYLPESVRKFPGAELLADEMRAIGYLDVEFERMTFGVVALHIGRV